MSVWSLNGGLVSLTALVLWVRWLRTPSSSTWHQGYLRSTLLHGVPGFLGGVVVVMFMRFAESIGVPDAVITGVAALPVFACLGLGVLVITVYAGVPAPPFCVPQWIRGKDRDRRALQRARKRERALERAAKRAPHRGSQRGE